MCQPPPLPRANPSRLARLRRFPQHEVERVTLVGIFTRSPARSCPASCRTACRSRESVPIIHVAVLRLVGQALVDQRGNKQSHLRDVGGGARFDIGLLHAERSFVLVHRLDETRGQLRDGFVVLGGTLDDLVVDVGDVANISGVEAAGGQPALDHVEHHHHPRVAKVAVVVHCHPAHVHSHLSGENRGKSSWRGKRVINLQHRESFWVGCTAPPNADRPGARIVEQGALLIESTIIYNNLPFLIEIKFST